MIGKYKGNDIEFDENSLDTAFVSADENKELNEKYNTACTERDTYKSKYEALNDLYKQTFSRASEPPTTEAPEDKLNKVFKEVFGD